MKFIHKNGRIIPIKDGGSHGKGFKPDPRVTQMIKNARATYDKHFGKADPIKKPKPITNKKLFEVAKKRKGFIAYATQRVAKAVTKDSAKALRKFGRGHAGVGSLAIIGGSTLAYGGVKAYKYFTKKPDAGPQG